MSHWAFVLTPLTPLHIGSGDTLAAYEYVVIDNRLHRFSPEALLCKLSQKEQEEFLSLVEIDPGGLQRFLQQRRDLVTPIAEYSLPLTGEAMIMYRERLSNPAADLSVYPFIATNNKPFIPGSSLKGAIRTALLFTKAHHPIRERNARVLEAQTFSYAKTVRGELKIDVIGDPFKTFKVGDSEALSDATNLTAVKVYTRAGGQWRESIPMMREVTGAKILPPQRDFVHHIQLNEELGQHDPRLMTFSIEEIVNACRRFYGLHLKNEASYLSGLDGAADTYRTLEEYERSLASDSFLVRFGWGSGFDAVTINYAKEPREEKRSRRLVDGGVPLGWAQVKVKPC